MTQLRSAWSGLKAAPGMTALAIFLLALGLAAATVTFSVVDHVVLRRLPFPDDDKLFVIGRTTKANPTPGNVSPQDFLAWKDRIASVADLAGAGQWIPLRLTTDAGPVSLRTIRVTSNLFNLLGVSPVMGSPWQPDQDRPGSDQVVAISHMLWQRQFGSDPSVIGRQVAFGSKSLRVVAVMPAGFTYPIDVGAPIDAWIPFAFNDRERDPASPGRSGNLLVVGRLKSGATIAVARAGVEETTAAMSRQYPTWGWKDARPAVEVLRDFVAGPARRWMLLVLGAVMLVLLVANFNVANLLLARAAGRGPELAMRAALGASPGRLLQMLLFESVILSVTAGALGLVIAARGIRIVKAVLPDGIARASTISLDARVVVVSIAAALVTGVVFGVVPAWRASRVDLVGVLKRGASRMSGAGAGAGLSWRSVFLVSEIAFVTAVLVATALFVTSFARVVGTDLGFERRGLVAIQVPSGSFDALPEPNRSVARGAYFDDVLRRAQDAAGDERVAMVDGALPLLAGGVQYDIHRPGGRDMTGDDSVSMHSVSPEYLNVAGGRLLGGRFLQATDTAAAGHVAVLNDVAARRIFGGGDPVGQALDFFGPLTIVGVVQAQHLGGPEIPVRPEMYVPISQGNTMFGSFGQLRLIVRAGTPAEPLAAAVRSAVQAGLPAGQRVSEPESLDDTFRKLTADRRFSAGLMLIFGATAVAIGALGVYGVMAFLVGQRTREVGVRVALGATRRRVLAMMLGQAAVPIAIGLALGLVAARAATGLVAAALLGVQPTDPVVVISVVAVLVVVGFTAALVPAMRASRVDPIVALRAE